MSIKTIKGRKKVLLKDIVIPAGTVFSHIPSGSRTEYNSDDHFDAIIGLSKDTFGTLVYGIDENFADQMDEWFADVQGGE